VHSGGEPSSALGGPKAPPYSRGPWISSRPVAKAVQGSEIFFPNDVSGLNTYEVRRGGGAIVLEPASRLFREATGKNFNQDGGDRLETGEEQN
jgi:hypothetical protein